MFDRALRSLRGGTVLALAILISACATFSYQEEEIVLEQTTWRVVSVDGADMPRRFDNRDMSPHIYIDSAEGRIHGAGGCNRFSGSYRATGTEMSVGDVVTTRSICAEQDWQRLEDRFFEVLQEVDSYVLEGERLWLYTGNAARIEAELW